MEGSFMCRSWRPTWGCTKTLICFRGVPPGRDAWGQEGRCLVPWLKLASFHNIGVIGFIYSHF